MKTGLELDPYNLLQLHVCKYRKEACRNIVVQVIWEYKGYLTCWLASSYCTRHSWLHCVAWLLLSSASSYLQLESTLPLLECLFQSCHAHAILKYADMGYEGFLWSRRQVSCAALYLRKSPKAGYKSQGLCNLWERKGSRLSVKCPWSSSYESVSCGWDLRSNLIKSVVFSSFYLHLVVLFSSVPLISYDRGPLCYCR